jgi:hypothetical protein
MATVTGGDKLQAELQRMVGEVTTAQSVKVGFLANATYPDGTPVAMVAAIQNWGAPRAGIPPRPFFSNMIVAKQAEWGPATGALLVANNYNAARTLAQVGEAISGQLREGIINTNDPPLSQVTLMIRKMKSEGATITRKSLKVARQRLDAGESVAGVSTKTLIETSNMINSVAYEVTGT